MTQLKRLVNSDMRVRNTWKWWRQTTSGY